MDKVRGVIEEHEARRGAMLRTALNSVKQESHWEHAQVCIGTLRGPPASDTTRHAHAHLCVVAPLCDVGHVTHLLRSFSAAVCHAVMLCFCLRCIRGLI